MSAGTVGDGDDGLWGQSGMGMNISGDDWGWKQILQGRMGMETNIHPRAALYTTLKHPESH